MRIKNPNDVNQKLNQSFSIFTAGKLYIYVRAARILRRLLDDRPFVGPRRRGSAAEPLEERPHTSPGGHSRREQSRPRSQSSRLDRR